MSGWVSAKSLNISIHALRGEGDEQKSKEAIKTNISIHALRGEGDAIDICPYCHCDISIHALRGEGDYRADNATTGKRTEFQSTPSVGRATPNKCMPCEFVSISIHALRGEGDS